MAFSNCSLACFLLSMLAFYLVDSSYVEDHRVLRSNSGRSLTQVTPPTGIDCVSACDLRCSKSWQQKMCLKLCNICCGKCSCVPGGPSADDRAAACSCYANMRNPKGHLKCP